MLGARHLKQLISSLIYSVKAKMPFFIVVWESWFVCNLSAQNGFKGINYLHEWFHLFKLTKSFPAKPKQQKNNQGYKAQYLSSYIRFLHETTVSKLSCIKKEKWFFK